MLTFWCYIAKHKVKFNRKNQTTKIGVILLWQYKCSFVFETVLSCYANLHQNGKNVKS